MNFKFRVWDTEDKLWLGDREYSLENNNHLILYSSVFEIIDTFYCGADDSRFIIQQYTGLKDSEGNEVYEGDVIEFDKPVAPYCMGSDGFESNKLNEVKYGKIIYFAGSFHIECPYCPEEIISVGKCKVVGDIFNADIK